MTSVEFLPLDAATAALKALAATDVTLLDGDGTEILPNLTLGLAPREAQQATRAAQKEQQAKAE